MIDILFPELDKKEIGRIEECLFCQHWKKCDAYVLDPEDYPDGTCKTKDIFRGGDEN